MFTGDEPTKSLFFLQDDPDLPAPSKDLFRSICPSLGTVPRRSVAGLAKAFPVILGVDSISILFKHRSFQNLLFLLGF